MNKEHRDENLLKTQKSHLLIQEASLAVIFRAEFGSIMEGMAEDVYAMQIPEDKHHVDTETAGNTYKVIKY